jgi:hypothetical protein
LATSNISRYRGSSETKVLDMRASPLAVYTERLFTIVTLASTEIN